MRHCLEYASFLSGLSRIRTEQISMNSEAPVVKKLLVSFDSQLKTTNEGGEKHSIHEEAKKVSDTKHRDPGWVKNQDPDPG